MKIQYFIYALLGIVLLVGLSFGLGWTDVFYTETISKAKENARREVFEQSQSYVEAKRQELTKYRLEYLRSKDDQEKTAIKMTIVHSFANFDDSKLDYDLKLFLDEMRHP